MGIVFVQEYFFLISKIILNINLRKQLIAVFENKDLYAIQILIYQVIFIM